MNHGMTQRNHDLALRMAELARAPLLRASVDDVLVRRHDRGAKELIPGVDIAGVLLDRQGRQVRDRSRGTDDLTFKLDELQMRYGEGPCVEAALDEIVVRTDDFRNEPRCRNTPPRWSSSGCSARCRSSSTPPIAPPARSTCSRSSRKLWDSEAETVGMVLAAHAAAAILASREGEQLQSALSTRDRIGQAKGIIMERFNIDDVRAFAMLRQLSQDTNIKLIDVAQRVIDTRSERQG